MGRFQFCAHRLYVVTTVNPVCCHGSLLVMFKFISCHHCITHFVWHWHVLTCACVNIVTWCYLISLPDEQHYGVYPNFRNPYMRGSTITKSEVKKCLDESCSFSLYPVQISAKGRSIHTVPTGMNMLCCAHYFTRWVHCYCPYPTWISKKVQTSTSQWPKAGPEVQHNVEHGRGLWNTTGNSV